MCNFNVTNDKIGLFFILYFACSTSTKRSSLMKVCFPVETDQGLASKVYGHFGSAPLFIMYNTETSTFEKLVNQDADHEHGKCNPVQALDGEKVDAVIVGGIGKGAINKLQALGIKVYSATNGTVEENLALFGKSQMIEISKKDGCSGHGHNGDCNH